MSALLLFKFSTKHIKFDEENKLANEIVNCALKNYFAVSFNNCVDLISQEDNFNSFFVSDSFLYTHADEILDLTDFVFEDEPVFKKRFIEKYSFLEKLIEILFHYKTEFINIFFSEYGETDLKEYLDIEATAQNVLEKIYEVFIKNSNDTGFTFPNIMISIKNR